MVRSRIFRIPNNGAGDNDILDDIYVAAMGGGYLLSLRVLDQI